MYMNEGSFTYKANDLHKFKFGTSDEDITKLIAALILFEREHPGILSFMLRLTALVIDDWHITSHTSHPERSLSAQLEFDDWLQSL